MAKLDVMLGFDMETDVGSWTPYYDGVVSGTPVILNLLKKHGVTATFFFTGDCARKQPQIVHAVRAAGHEVGCHTLFHETIGDQLFDIPGMPPILPEEVERRLQLATEWVESVSGARPVSFRAPRLFGSTAMILALDNLGYVADATYPMYYFREQLVPYHPSRENWTKCGHLRIVELPNFADLTIKSQDPLGRDMDQWPLFRTENAPSLISHIDNFCGYVNQRGLKPFLCFYFHPWEFYPMPQGEIHFGEGFVRADPFIVKNCGPYAAGQLDALLGMLQERGAEFYQAQELAKHY